MERKSAKEAYIEWTEAAEKHDEWEAFYAGWQKGQEDIETVLRRFMEGLQL